MVKKLLYFLVYLIFYPLIHKGDSIPVAAADTCRYSIGLSGSFLLNSNLLSTNHISRFYFGRTIPRELREKTSRRAISGNRAVAAFSNQLYFTIAGDNIGWTFSASDKMYAETKFTGDLYDLVFLGNRHLQGKTADLSSSGFRFWRYEQVKATASFVKGSGKFEAGFSVISAHNYFEVKTDEASLFTDSFGIALDLKADADMRRPDPSSKKAFSRGQGAAVDFSYSRYMPSVRSEVKVSAEDIGFVQFNKRAVTETVDTTIRYEGFKLEKLFPFGDSLNPAFSGDSVRSRYVRSDTSSFLRMIPAVTAIEFKQMKESWVFTERLVFRPFTYALPELTFEAMKHKGKLYCSLLGHLGGYSYAGVGFRAGYRAGRTSFSIDASRIEGLILPGLTTGIVAGFNIRTCF